MLSTFVPRSLHIRIALLGVLSAALAPSIHAQDLGNGWSPNALEISRTPSYCQKQFNSKHDGKVMAPLFGGCGGYMNHFCPGLVLIQRASNLSIPKGERKRILAQAKNEIGYTTSRGLPPTCPLMDDIRGAESQIKVLDMMLK